MNKPPPKPTDVRELCLVCRAPAQPGRPTVAFSGFGDNAMYVSFALHVDCRPVFENRRAGVRG